MNIHAIHTIQRGDKDDPKVIVAGFKGNVDLRDQEVKDLLANNAIVLLDDDAITSVVEALVIGNEDIGDDPEPVAPEDDEPEFNPVPEAILEPAAFDREALEARAIELKVEFRSNISDAKLAERVAAAEQDDGGLV